MDADHGASDLALSRRSRALLSVGTVLAALFAGWLVVRDDEVMPDASTRWPPPPIATASASATAAVTRVDASRLPDRPTTEGEIEVCPGRWLKLGSDGQPDEESQRAESRRQVEMIERVLASMESSADERSRATALAIQANPLFIVIDRWMDCGGEPVCESKRRRRLRDVAAYRDALARTALGSSDPVVYGMAVEACTTEVKTAEGQWERPDGQCQLISAAQWARLDSANAHPWLAVAREAQARGDAETVASALYRMSTAERVDSDLYGVGMRLLEHAPIGEGRDVDALSLAVFGIGHSAATEIAADQALIGFCRREDLVDAQRREVCDRIATQYVERARTWSSFMTGSALTRRLEWSGDRKAALDRRKLEIEAGLPSQGSSLPDAYTCRGARAQVERLRNIDRRGEISVLLDAGRPATVRR